MTILNDDDNDSHIIFMFVLTSTDVLLINSTYRRQNKKSMTSIEMRQTRILMRSR